MRNRPLCPRRKAEAGYSLLELLVVLAILGLIIGLVGPRVMTMFERSKAKAAEIQMHQIAMALDIYRLELGALPGQSEGLNALMSNPNGKPAWRGPYLADAKGLTDPWGNPYQYRIPGSKREYDLLSFGADGREGGTGEASDIALN